MNFAFYKRKHWQVSIDIWVNGSYDTKKLAGSLETYKTLTIQIGKYVFVFDYSRQKISTYRKIL